MLFTRQLYYCLFVVFVSLPLLAKHSAGSSASMITVTSPSTDTRWDVAHSCTITWNSDYLAYRDSLPVRIDLEIEGEFFPIARELKDLGFFTFTLSDSLPYSSECIIWVTLHDHEPGEGAIGGFSPEFTISGPPRIRLTRPTVDTTEVRWQHYIHNFMDERMDIRWTVEGTMDDSYDLYYRTDEISEWTRIARDIGYEYYRWKIPYVNASQEYFFKVCAQDTFADSTPTPVTIVPLPRRIELPEMVNESRPRFAWHPVEGIDTYIIEARDIYTDQFFCDTVSDTTYSGQFYLPTGRVYWRVWPEPIAMPAYTNLKTFSAFICDPAVPDLIPAQQNPTRERRPLFAWHPHVKTMSYEIQFSSKKHFYNQTIILSKTVNDTLFRPTVDLPCNTIYWRAKAAGYDNFSLPESLVIVADTLPFLKPYKGDTVESTKPTFEWEPIEKAQSYKIEIFSANQPLAKRRGAAESELHLIHSEIVHDNKYIPSVDLPSQQLLWRVSSDINYEEFSPLDEIVISTEAIATPVRDFSHDGMLGFSVMQITDGSLHIRLSGRMRSNGVVRLYSPQGKCLHTQRVTGDTCTIRRNAHPALQASGVYFVSVSSQTHTVVSKVTLY